MTQEERCGTRDRAYSAWHRRYSIGRFVGRENAHLLAMIDLDTIPYVEYEDKTKKPLAVIETAIDIGQTFKTATVTSNLAKLAGLPCFVVLYKLSDKPNPADRSCFDIEGFRIKRLYPERDNEWKYLTPQRYAEMLLKIRYHGTEFKKDFQRVLL